MFCVDLFYDFQDDGTGKPVPYREIGLFRSVQAHFKRALCEESSTVASDGPPPFERRLLREFDIFFCVGLFFPIG